MNALRVTYRYGRLFPAALIFPFLLLAAPHTAWAEAAEDEEAQPIEEVVVTGSRIKRSDFTSASPITVVTGQSILESGFSNIAEALRNEAAAGTAGFNQQSVLSGGGASSIDLRGLGQDRVLILVNGKRVASFADSLANQAIDLTFVPQAMVERVDILRDGASAVYGADAVSGVVNVILKENFEGIQAGASSGMSGEGDAEQHTAEFAIGTTGDRGSMVLGAEYRWQNNLPQTERDWAFPAISALRSTSAGNGSYFSPGGVFFSDNGYIHCTMPKAFGGDEVTNVFPGCPSFLSVQTVSDPDDVELLRYDYALQQDIYGHSKVYAFAGYGVYEIAQGLEGFIEAQYSKRMSQFRLDGNPGSFGTPGIPQGWRVPASNPHNPYGAAGSLYIRPTSTVGARVSDHESDTLRLAAGFRGDIVSDNFFDEWSWELSYLFTRVDANLFTNSTWNLRRVNVISDPDLCAADPICAQAVNPSGAMDAFRPGNWTRSEIEYIRQNTVARSEFETSGIFAMATGPIFELPAGDVQAAIGYERRVDKGFNKPDPVTEAGESVANQVFTTEGSFNVNEIFGEVEIPLVADEPGFQSVDLNVQARWSDYSNFGQETVWRAGLNWQVINDIRIRSTMSTAYRAPSVTDLFSGGVVSFDFFTHPCAAGDPSRQPGNNVDQNCLLDGIGPGNSQVASQFAVLRGGNPELQPETADTVTVGGVLTPRFLDGFSMSVDYWDIELENGISGVTSDSIVDNCYAGPVGLTAPECGRFTSVLGGAGITVQGLVNVALNLAEVEASGVDVGMRYETEGPADTYITLDLQSTYLIDNSFYPGVGGADDRGSIPRIRANIVGTVDWRSFDFLVRMRYIHGMDDPRYDGNNAFGYDTVPSHREYDVRVGWNLDRYRAVLGVNDLFDNDPPYIFSSGNNSDLFLYGAIGRYIFLRLSANL